MAPARLQLFTDPTVEVVWAAICALEEGLQHEVLEMLRQRLAAADIRETPQATRQARAVAALRECAAVVGRTPTVADYRRERVDHPEWPDDAAARKWLGGSWRKALEAARLDADTTGAAPTMALGPAFTRGEVETALRDCAAELSADDGERTVPALHTYLAWARRPEIQRRPGRRPRSQSVFDRLYGGYLPALTAAGLVAGPGDAAAPRSSTARFASGYRYTDEQLLAGLDRVVRRAIATGASRSRDGFVTSGAYSRIRQEILDGLTARGEPPIAIPSYQRLWRRWGSWAGVKAAYEKANQVG